ncbi:type II toxin-antitoxin system VapB family antitoxin [Microbacterium candidum]|uniref:Type II toxin-antitoxin system VapB family antitoxin n=1 Tax=Microbacterium candidum TaxID=3041922 RepID=A0ABT7MWU9_9MICO|nr:type II toxin-antitoxin system VapB family antitoxin [Microbacterium sp. ASV49]MDL9978919.1 type II toxin-antitoxin system VapB family antitoxin [Microbacterium sp. ASV49]
MSLNIKNDDVHEAVRELADALGVSQTSAVEIAVRAKLAELDSRRDARVARLRSTVATAQAAFADVDLRTVEADLYDEAGLPR